jgi:hypothetical protein
VPGYHAAVFHPEKVRVSLPAGEGFAIKQGTEPFFLSAKYYGDEKKPD